MDEKCAMCGHLVPTIDQYECLECGRIICPDCWSELQDPKQENESDVCGECFRNDKANKEDEFREEERR
jgi:hypothetical protein